MRLEQQASIASQVYHQGAVTRASYDMLNKVSFKLTNVVDASSISWFIMIGELALVQQHATH